jgi:PKD repeat protein
MGGWGRHVVAAVLAIAAIAAAPTASADHPQPAPDISQLEYLPLGQYGPGRPSPAVPADARQAPTNPNPSGKWNAYDLNVYHSLNFPSRYPGDEKGDDPPGTGDPRHGFCPPSDPRFLPWGLCANHQLEFRDHFEKITKEILGDFGVAVKSYEFTSPGRSDIGTGRGGYLDQAGGRGLNLFAVVPGADHPEQSVVIAAHNDTNDSAPASGWDASEGHANVIRVAKLMSDYWRRTGTRPSVTVKFGTWDAEEGGTFGSLDYLANNVPPGEEGKIRGYHNMDPCAGAYPAYKNGNPAQRVPEVMEVADPANYPAGSANRNRVVAYNARAERVVDEVFGHLDDTLAIGPGTTEPIFVSDAEAAAGGGSSQRGEIVTAVGGLAAFGSDHTNFANQGIPIFNLFPDYFGPHADLTPASVEGVGILHTPRDNLTTLNALTSSDQTGLSVSEGWAKGMEMCAQMNAWFMLQPIAGGTQTSTPDVVAYYEALPNQALQRQRVTFDASGSYRYAQLATRQLTDDSKLKYEWDFGDGSTGTGRTAEHGYREIGRYESRLTVTDTETGQSDTMTLPIEVIGSNFVPPELTPPAAEDPDGNFPLAWTFEGTRSGFQHFAVEESSDLRTLLDDDAEGDLAARWSASKSEGADPDIDGWQKSDSSATKFRGNQSKSGETSYWAGNQVQNFPPGANTSGMNVGEVDTGDAILTLKQPFEVPKEGEALLTYASLFQMEGDDQGRVEVARDDGNPDTPLEWQAVEVLQATATAAGDADPLVCDPSQPATSEEPLRRRQADLGRFKGARVLVRFVLRNGADNRAVSQPCGWYIDDIRVQAGTWTEIGTTATRAFDVFGKTAGTYGYRVRGVYNDGVTTAPSNAEVVKVTAGVPPGGGPPETPAVCTSNLGFRSVSAKPRGRGLRFAWSQLASGPVRVELIQQARGNRVVKNRTVRRFRGATRGFAWNGRGTKLSSGYYAARFILARPGRRAAVRMVGLRYSGGRFRSISAYQRREGCGTLRSFFLSRPVFGGRSGSPLGQVFRLLRPGRVSISVTRGKAVVRTYSPQDRLAGITYKVLLGSATLKRGDYRVRIRVERAGETTSSVLVSRRL